jgi:hypothetical protein
MPWNGPTSIEDRKPFVGEPPLIHALADGGFDRRQRNSDRGAHVDAEVADRPFGADLRNLLEGVEGRPPLGHRELREVGVVADDDRAFRLTRRPRPVQRGDLLLVVRGARPVAVTGRVDDRDVEAAAGHEAVGTAGHRRCLLVCAAAVPHQDQGRVIGAGSRRPEHAGDLAHGEVALDHTVRRRLGSEVQRVHTLLPFRSALVVEALPATPTSNARP